MLWLLKGIELIFDVKSVRKNVSPTAFEKCTKSLANWRMTNLWRNATKEMLPRRLEIVVRGKKWYENHETGVLIIRDLMRRANTPLFFYALRQYMIKHIESHYCNGA